MIDREPRLPRHENNPSYRPKTLRSPGLLRTRELVDIAAEHSSSVLLQGNAGLGKTFAAEEACHRAGVPYVTVRYHRSNSTAKKLARSIGMQLYGFIPRGSADDIMCELRPDLSGMALIFDEVHEAGTEAQTWLVDLWNDGADRIMLICIGSLRSAQILDANPMIGRRIKLRHSFTEPPERWMRNHIAPCHPCLVDATDECLDFVADTVEEKELTFSFWQDFATWATTVCRENSVETVDQGIALDVLTRMGLI